MDKNLLRYMTVKVKSFDLKTNYFSNKDKEEESTDNSSVSKRNKN